MPGAVEAKRLPITSPGPPRRMQDVQDFDGVVLYAVENLVGISDEEGHPDIQISVRYPLNGLSLNWATA